MIWRKKRRTPFMPDISLAAALLQQNKNILTMDVCSLLDALRPPVRGGRDAVEYVLRIDRKMQAGMLPFVLILPSLFAHEWETNAAKVKDELIQALAFHKGQSEYLDFLHQLLYDDSLPMPDVTQIGFVSDIEQACSQIMAAAQTIEENNAAILLAAKRSVKGRAPASLTKPEFKDCVIFEEFLSLGRELRGAGFTGKIVFVSSNTSDYGRSKQPFPEIAADLQAIQAEFASTLNYAYHLAAQE